LELKNLNLILSDMNNNQIIAKIFNEIADALEFLGDNPFKIRAYRTAANVIEGLVEDISVYIQRNEKIYGIGEDLKEKIIEFLIRYARASICLLPACAL